MSEQWTKTCNFGGWWQSHQSYSKCGLGSHGTDRLVSLVKQSGQQPSRDGAAFFGAKITGGGCGGTVCVLGRTGVQSNDQILQVWTSLGNPIFSFTVTNKYISNFSHLVIRLKLKFPLHNFYAPLPISDLLNSQVKVYFYILKVGSNVFLITRPFGCLCRRTLT